MGVMLTASKVKMMFTALDVAADQEWLRQREVKRVAILAYRRGWYYRHLGALRESCYGEAELAGWDASDRAHEAMVKIGVRE
jgi:hypothetical protein